MKIDPLFNTDKNRAHKPLCSLSDFVKIKGNAGLSSINNWKKNNPLPLSAATTIKGHKETRLYVIDELQAWHDKAKANSACGYRIGKKYTINY